MPGRLFIDTNVPIYATGREHSYKEVCLDILFKIAKGDIDACTDAEVHQELYYYYWVRGLADKGLEVSAQFLASVPDVLPITRVDLERALELGKSYPYMLPRDWIHLATMLNHGISEIVTADKHFDNLGGIVRLDPKEWSRI